MIPYDAEKLLLFLEEEEFIVNKVKKMLYSQKVAPYVFVLPFVISLWYSGYIRSSVVL